MSKKIIQTGKAPEAIGPYSQAVIHNGIVYCSGQIAFDPVSMTIVDGGIREQSIQVMENIGQVLQAANSNFSKVLKVTIYLHSMDDFETVNDIYGNYFNEAPPARETVAVKTLPKNVLVEISCMASV